MDDDFIISFVKELTQPSGMSASRDLYQIVSDSAPRLMLNSDDDATECFVDTSSLSPESQVTDDVPLTSAEACDPFTGEYLQDYLASLLNLDSPPDNNSAGSPEAVGSTPPELESNFLLEGSAAMFSPLPTYEDIFGKIEMVDIERELEPEVGNRASALPKTRETPIQPSGAPTYLCPVCGNQNGRHAHYGGYSCPSCRAFFRRSVQSKAYKTFSCSSGNCKINSKSWRSCKWCRFQKCLRSGMKPEWVLDKNERNTKSAKRDLVEISEVSSALPASALTVRPAGFTNDELLMILSHVDCRKMNMSKSLLHFYATFPSLFKQLVSSIYSNSIMSHSTYRHLESKWPCTMEDFVIRDSELGALSESDSMKLLKANFPLLQIFVQSVIMMNNQHFKATPLANILKRAIRVSQHEEDRDKLEVLNEVLRDFSIDPKKPYGAITYEQVFASPWANSINLEERHEQLTREMSSWPVNPKDPAKHVDKVQLFLLANIIMLSTDNVQVDDYQKVTAVQDRYMTMLHRYLKYKYKDNSNTQFAKGLMITSLAKEALEIRTHRLPV